MLIIKTKKLRENAVMPQRMNVGDAGFDLVATSMRKDHEHGVVVFGTGLAFELPEGYAMFVYPRSSSYKHHALMANCVGVVDSGYRGEVHVMFSLKKKLGTAKVICKPPVLVPKTAQESSLSKLGEMAHV